VKKILFLIDIMFTNRHHPYAPQAGTSTYQNHAGYHQPAFPAMNYHQQYPQFHNYSQQDLMFLYAGYVVSPRPVPNPRLAEYRKIGPMRRNNTGHSKKSLIPSTFESLKNESKGKEPSVTSTPVKKITSTHLESSEKVTKKKKLTNSQKWALWKQGLPIPDDDEEEEAVTVQQSNVLKLDSNALKDLLKHVEALKKDK